MAVRDPAGLGLDWVGAVEIGHAILHRRRCSGAGFVGGSCSRTSSPTPVSTTFSARCTCRFHILAQATSAVLSVGRPVAVSRVHDRNPLEQTFICLGAGATHTALPPGFDAEDFLGRFSRVIHGYASDGLVP